MNPSEYRSAPGINPSSLVHILKSPLHFRTVMDNPPEPSEPMRLGALIHCLALEPTQFPSRYCVLPDFHRDEENCTDKGKPSTSKNTNYYRQQKDAFEADNADKELVTAEQLFVANRVCESVARHLPPYSSGRFELPLFGEIEGVEVKGRIDHLSGAAIVDLKTVNNCAPDAFFRKSFHALQMDFRLAFYRELVRQNYGRTLPVEVITAETAGDFDSVRYAIPETLIDQGMVLVHRAILQYRACLDRDEWPGVDGGERSVELPVPNWAMWESDDVVEVYQGD